MGHNEETTSIKSQEDQAMLSLTAFDKEKLLAMQQQVLEGMTQHGSFPQCLPQGQTNMPKGLVKRQVAEAWKKMKSNEGVHSKTLGSQYQCQCCMHYGFPYLRNKPNQGKVEVNPSYETNVDKKRKANSLEQVLGSNQHLDLSHLALIPSQMNLNCKELEASQAKTTSHEVCIDGWTITYKEFQPRKTKQARKHKPR